MQLIGFGTFTELSRHHYNLFLEHVHQPNKEIRAICSIPYPSQFHS